MILDSSAVVAIFRRESTAPSMRAKIEATSIRAIGAPTLVETGLVLTARLGTSSIGSLSRFLEELKIFTIPFGEDHWREAVAAFDRFGKGRHPAALNLGDCMTYAVAKLSGEPLLCTGNDFARTDLVIA